MIQSRFEQNRKALEEKNPALLSLVSQSKLSLPPFPTPSGHPTCRIRGENGELVLLHSDQDPVAEAEEAIHTKGEDAILLLGMGLGYTGLELVRRLSPWTWITVIEPDPGILRAAMEYVDLTPLFSRDRVAFFVGQEGALLQEHLRIWFNKSEVDNITQLTHLPLEKARPSVYRRAYKDVLEAINYRNTEIATLLKHGKPINRNSVLNIPATIRSQGVKVFENQFKGVPAVVVAAGPSLESQMEALKQVRDRAIIICVGKSLRFLLENGIDPHFTAHLDLGEESKVYFEGVQIPDSCTLVWDPEANSSAISGFPGDRITFQCGMDWENRGKAFWGEKGYLQRGLSVAHTAFHFTRALGADPIALVGVDLGFPGERTHAEGVTMTWGGGFESIEKSMREVPSVTGGTVKSIPSFQAMVTLFETEISKTDAQVINTSKVGALIRGAKNQELESILGDPIDIRGKIKGKLDQPRPFQREAFQEFSDKLCSSMERISEVSESGLRALKRVRRLNLSNRDDVQELDRLGKKVNSYKNELEREKDFQLILQRYFSHLAVQVRTLARKKANCSPEDLVQRTKLDCERLGLYFEEFKKGCRFLQETFLPVKEKLLG